LAQVIWLKYVVARVSSELAGAWPGKLFVDR